jgi:hypothetical protein
MHHKKRKDPSVLDNDHGPFWVVDENGGVNITRRGYRCELGAVMAVLVEMHTQKGGGMMAVWGMAGV